MDFSENDPYTMRTAAMGVRTAVKTGNGQPQHQRVPEQVAAAAQSQPESASESAGPMRAQIREAELVTAYRPRPTMGWRKGLYRRTRINLGPGPKERAWNDLE